jgi:hypothetical protein
MAITDTTRITSAINKQSTSTDPGCGCGAVLVPAGHSLPAGDYVMVKAVTSTGNIVLSNIVWKGEGWLDATSSSYAPLTSITLDSRCASFPYEMNIESCDVATTGAVFFKRCK